MAKVTVPPGVVVVVSSGTASDLIICNDGSNQMALNVGDPSPGAGGGAINLAPNDSVAMLAGSAWAAASWSAYSSLGTIAVVVEV